MTAVLAACAALAAPACGGDDRAAVRTDDGPRASPTPVTTPSPTPPAPTATATPVAPAQQPDASPAPTVSPVPGEGDEEGIEQEARFVVAPDGGVEPRRIRVAAFLPLRIVVHNRSAAEVAVRAPEGEPRVLGPGESHEFTSSGIQPGRHPVLGTDEGEGVIVAVAGGG